MHEVSTDGWGFLSVYTGPTNPQYDPQASHMNYHSGPQVNTQFLLTDGGHYNVYSYNRVNLRQTLSAYFSSEAPPDEGFVNLHNPTRVYDSRQGAGKMVTPTAAGVNRPLVRRIRVAGVGGIPSWHVGAVLANVTIANATGYGSLSAINGNADIASLAFDPQSGDKANFVVIPVDDEGYATVGLKSEWLAAASAHVIIDVVGTVTGTSWLNGLNENVSSDSSGWGRWNCGYLSCSFYVKRGKTRSVANTAGDAAEFTHFLGAVTRYAPPNVRTAVTVLDGLAASVAEVSSNVAAQNQCLKVTFGFSATNGAGALSPFWLSGRNGPYCED
ncbi:MAG: hypothetical protein KBF88_02900 [Polyangiaceae bacterium]|nr:hypothetical protein [Polyangiaceae bacterium]